MTKKKKVVIVGGVLVLFIFIIAITFMFNLFMNLSTGYDESTCYKIPEIAFPDHMDSIILDCIGNIYIEKDNKCNDDVDFGVRCGELYIYDTNRNKIVISKIDSYNVVDDNIYIIGQLSVSRLFSDDREHLFYHSYNNGEEKSIPVENIKDMPQYVVINNKTSNTKFYKEFSEMDDYIKNQFIELESK